MKKTIQKISFDPTYILLNFESDLLSGLYKYFWLELHEQNQQMGLGPTGSH